MTRRLGPFPGRGAVFVSGGFELPVQLLYGAPKQIIAGDTIEFLVPIPSDLTGFTGSARLTGPSTMDGTVTTENADFRVRFAGVGGTSALTAGQYILTVWGTSGSDRYTVAQYRLTVEANLATGTPAQSHAQKMLALLETAIYNRVNGNTDGGIESYSIDGTSVAKMSMAELQRMRAKYAQEVAREQNPDAPFGSVKFAFTPAGNAVDLRRRYS